MVEGFLGPIIGFSPEFKHVNGHLSSCGYPTLLGRFAWEVRAPFFGLPSTTCARASRSKVSEFKSVAADLGLFFNLRILRSRDAIGLKPSLANAALSSARISDSFLLPIIK